MIEGDGRVDRWQIWSGDADDDPNFQMAGQGVDPPERHEPLGPWFPFAVSGNIVVWRRPLRFVKASELPDELPPEWRVKRKRKLKPPPTHA